MQRCASGRHQDLFGGIWARIMACFAVQAALQSPDIIHLGWWGQSRLAIPFGQNDAGGPAKSFSGSGHSALCICRVLLVPPSSALVNRRPMTLMTSHGVTSRANPDVSAPTRSSHSTSLDVTARRWLCGSQSDSETTPSFLFLSFSGLATVFPAVRAFSLSAATKHKLGKHHSRLVYIS